MGARFYGITDTDSLITHGAVIRAVAEYAARALEGRGSILIGDCPVQGTSWDAVCALAGLHEIAAQLRALHPGISCELADLRLGRAEMRGERLARRIVDAPPTDRYREVDLGRDSMLLPLMERPFAFGVSQYPRHRMRRAHSPERNLYLIPRDFLEADAFINVPKLKSHMKAGVTCALKNLVGINGHKDYLPHFRFGSPRHGGDEYPDGNWLADAMWWLQHQDWERDSGLVKAGCFYLAGFLNRVLQYGFGYPKGYMTFGGGSWYGNDTVWRMVLDLNRLLLYYDAARQAVHPGRAPARFFTVLDGLVGGHRESPLAPTPYPSGVVMACGNAVAIDTVAAAYMGFDWRRIPQVARAFDAHRLPLTAFGPEDIRVVGLDGVERVEDIYERGACLAFEPSAGFRGHLEHPGRTAAAPDRSAAALDTPAAALPDA